MPSELFADNPAYVQYESLLARLHQLSLENRATSNEARAVREEMAEPESWLAPEEIRRLQGLSADLYMLEENEVYERVAPDEWPPERISADLKAAWDARDWEQALAVLRKGPSLFPPAQTAYFRARAYEQLGHKETALLFMKHAARLNPHHSRYAALVLRLLVELGRFDEALMIAETYMRDRASAPALLIESASVLFRASRIKPAGESAALLERAIKTLQRALDEGTSTPGTPADVLISGHVILGACCEERGRHGDAERAYAAALQLDPTNEMVLLALAQLRRHLDRLRQAAPAGRPDDDRQSLVDAFALTRQS